MNVPLVSTNEVKLIVVVIYIHTYLNTPKMNTKSEILIFKYE